MSQKETRSCGTGSALLATANIWDISDTKSRKSAKVFGLNRWDGTPSHQKNVHWS